ncbi:MAG: hypothetical protein GY769_20285 [bacterium]|nr:hypothetical protein [bacterium]
MSVKTYIDALVIGAEAAGSFASGTAKLVALSVAGILKAVSGLLADHTPEETQKLIEDLVANPAKKVDLGDLDAVEDKVEDALND